MRNLLGADTDLNILGITSDRIWPNFSLDGAPRDGIPWLILRWGLRTPRFGSVGGPGKQKLTVWAYRIRQASTDFTVLDDVLSRVVEIMATTEQFESDDSVISTVDFNGYSEDINDNGYDAIAKNADFTVVCR